MTVDPAAAKRAAHGILSRPQFASSRPSWYDRARTWLADEIHHLFSGSWANLGVGGVVVLVVVLAALAWVTVLWARSLSHDRQSRGGWMEQTGRPPEDWLAEADACERRQDFRGALRARYRALIAELARRGLIREIPGLTTGEYRRDVDDALPRGAPGFDEVTDLFERVFYGDAAAGPLDADHARQLADRVLELAR